MHEILGNSQLLGGLGANDGEGVCAAAEIDESGEPYLESMRDTENDKAAQSGMFNTSGSNSVYRPTYTMGSG